MNLSYGKGKAILDVNMDVISILITYKGNPFILYKRKNSKDSIDHQKNRITISGKDLKGDLFKYFGYLKIDKCVCVSSTFQSINVKVKTMNIHFPELMDQFPEDISAFPENLRQGYVMIKRYKGKQYRTPKSIKARTPGNIPTRTRRTY